MRDNTHIVITSWMRSELNLSGNDLLVYAVIYGFSQDGETKFAGSRQYIADWCGCTVRSVQTILNNLTEKGLITKYESVKCGVKTCEYVANFTTSEIFSPPVKPEALDSEKISPPPSEKISPNNNIYNNTSRITRSSINTTTPNFGYADNTTTEDILEDAKKEDEDVVESHAYSQEDLKREFLGSAKKNRHTKAYTRKQSLYEQCSDAVTAYTKNIALQDALLSYLSVRLANKDKPMYGVNQWKGMLNKLSEVSGESFFDKSVEKRLEIVNRSIEHGWLSFYELKPKNGGPAGELGEVQCRKNVDEEILDEKY